MEISLAALPPPPLQPAFHSDPEASKAGSLSNRNQHVCFVMLVMFNGSGGILSVSSGAEKGAPGRGHLISLSGTATFPSSPRQPQRHCQRQRPGGGCARTSTSFWGPAPLVLFSLGIENANDLCPGLLPPGPPPFIFSFIPACLCGVGLKGAG